ncbi:hypothetical protein BB559_004855 [Furculomyces boomerangus]|uniref:RRM domain-containing protein n=1 Tax=Furculomyces boomerangus TaxID=61424 RepID=A0A2T9YC80_9FUNG|nr:hypothetical protein BB559_004855 [Furculomyces boomerangus]
MSTQSETIESKKQDQDSGTRGSSTLFVRGIPPNANNQQLEEFFSEIGPIRSCFIVNEKKAEPVLNTEADTKEEPSDPTPKPSLKEEKSASKGFGFVQYVLYDDAKTALDTLEGKLFLEKHKLKLEFAIKKGAPGETVPHPNKRKPKSELKKEKFPKKQKASDSKDNHFVKISDIKDGISLKELKHKIRKFGTIKQIVYSKDPEQKILPIDKGKVERVSLPRKYTGGPLRGFAFVQMNEVENAKKALEELNGTTLSDRTVAIDWAKSKDEKPNKKSLEEDESNKKKVVREYENTMFVRNVPFDVEEDELAEVFEVFGKVRYCRIVLDRNSQKSRGTAFVSYWKKEDYDKCISENAEAQKIAAESLDKEQFEYSLLSQYKNSDKTNMSNTRSVLLTETPKTLVQVSLFTIKGRLLNVTSALSRDNAEDLAKKKMLSRQTLDKRNVYLLREGVVFPNSEAASKFTPAELDLHQKYYGSRKQQINKNSNLYISKTRLCFRNIPRSATKANLRKAALDSITRFKANTKTGQCPHLTPEEQEEGWDKVPKIVQVKLLNSTSKPDENGKNTRHTGIGFVEFKHHAHALACLRESNLSDPSEVFFGTKGTGSKPETPAEDKVPEHPKFNRNPKRHANDNHDKKDEPSKKKPKSSGNKPKNAKPKGNKNDSHFAAAKSATKNMLNSGIKG